MTDTNKLIKNLVFDVIQGTSGTAATPGQSFRPFQPARCYNNEPSTSCGWEYVATTMNDPLSGFTTGVTSRVWVCSTNVSATCVPATPERPYIAPTPAIAPTETTVTKNFSLGWDGRARAIIDVPRQAAFASFKAKQSVAGIFIGFTEQHEDTGYLDIRHGVFLRHGTYKRIFNGVVQGQGLSYKIDSQFNLLLTSGFLQVSVTGDGHDSSNIHTHMNPEVFTAPLTLSACIYMADDFVYEPTLRGATEALVPMPAIQSLGGDGTPDNFAINDLPALHSFSAGYGISDWPEGLIPLGPFSYGNKALPAMISVGSDKMYAHSTTTLPALTAHGTGGLLILNTAIGVTALTPLSGYATGLTGEIGGGDAELPALVGIGSEGSYGMAEGTFPALWSYAHAYEGNNSAFLYGFSDVAPALEGFAELFVTIDETGGITGAFLAELVFTADMMETMTAEDSYQAQAELLAALMENAHVMGAAGYSLLKDFEIWVMNRRTEGFTRYEQRHFDAAAFYKGETYGVRSDGIYKVGGNDDAGNDIEASVNFGETGFGNSALKRIDGCYMGLSSDGTVYLKVKANNQTFTYAARNADEVLRTQRFTTGKGMKASYVNFEFINSNGADFEIDGVEFIAVPLTRRIR